MIACCTIGVLFFGRYGYTAAAKLKNNIVRFLPRHKLRQEDKVVREDTKRGKMSGSRYADASGKFANEDRKFSKKISIVVRKYSAVKAGVLNHRADERGSRKQTACKYGGEEDLGMKEGCSSDTDRLQ